MARHGDGQQPVGRTGDAEPERLEQVAHLRRRQADAEQARQARRVDLHLPWGARRRVVVDHSGGHPRAGDLGDEACRAIGRQARQVG